MNKTFFLSVAVCCIIASSGVSAQYAERDSVLNREKPRWGLKVGGQISAVDEIHFSSRKRFPGLVMGAMLQVPLQKKEKTRWFFMPELLYSQKGERDKPKGTNTEVKYYQDYLTLPLMLKGYFLKKHLYVELGPELGYMIYQKNRDIDLSDPDKWDVGLCFGAGVNLGNRNQFEVGARLDWGFVDMYPDTKKNNFNISGAVTLVYLFDRRMDAISKTTESYYSEE